ncbi:PLG [Cordylochernes scorpioides]|uniref:PLG n=1 Tax=Cordylochernes scorpioides TaxID=51811 RepID=A0ABY6KRQ5_9ARAC|nr:PLG [Cordylochernes scorpioides]
MGFYDGPEVSAPWMGRFCSEVKPADIESSQNALLLTFISDFRDKDVGRGFHFKYQSLPEDNPFCPEGQEMCRNRNCYSASQKCNTVDDCGDGTDEEECISVTSHQIPLTNHPLPSNQSSNSSNQSPTPSNQSLNPSNQLNSSSSQSPTPNNQSLTPSNQLNSSSNQSPNPSNQLNISSNQSPNPSNLSPNLSKNKPFQPSYTCGTPKISPKAYGGGDRIVGGVEATAHSWPWQFFMNRLYDFEHDFALIQLNAPITFTDHILPICLPDDQAKTADDSRCMATGWGMTKGSGSYDKLKQVSAPITETLSSKVKTSFVEGEGACNGDSGGPLVCQYPSTDKWTLYGVASHIVETNKMTAFCGYPGMYARVSTHMDWIKETMKKYS